MQARMMRTTTTAATVTAVRIMSCIAASHSSLSLHSPFTQQLSQVTGGFPQVAVPALPLPPPLSLPPPLKGLGSLPHQSPLPAPQLPPAVYFVPAPTFSHEVVAWHVS